MRRALSAPARVIKSCRDVARDHSFAFSAPSSRNTVALLRPVAVPSSVIPYGLPERPSVLRTLMALRTDRVPEMGRVLERGFISWRYNVGGCRVCQAI
jgi:hypothetical protein